MQGDTANDLGHAARADQPPHPLTQAFGRHYYDLVFKRGGTRRLGQRQARTLLTLTPDVDLRTLPDKPDLRWEWPIRVLLACGDHLDLSPFLEGVPLGPLATIPIYATDAQNRYVGKSHAPALCQHSDYLRDDDDVLALSEWVPIVARFREEHDPWLGDPRCSKCGGFAIWRFDDQQLAYYQAACRLSSHEIPNTLRWYDDADSRDAPDYLRGTIRSPSSIDRLSQVERELVSIYETLPDLADRVEPELARCRRLLRRATIRRDTALLNPP